MTTCDVLTWALAAVGVFGLLATITLAIVIVWVSRKGSKIGSGTA